MDIFLRAKHWQLFLLTVGVPILLDIVFLADVILQQAYGRGASNHPMLIAGYFKIYLVLVGLFGGMMFGWFWSVATGLQKMVPVGIKMKVLKFKIFFIIPLTYIAVIVFSLFLASSGSVSAFGILSNSGFAAFLIIVPAHLFSVFCIFYCLYFVAKTIKTVELQRNVTFSEFTGEFFLIWFYPIGIWIIQPKINKMISRASDPAE